MVACLSAVRTAKVFLLSLYRHVKIAANIWNEHGSTYISGKHTYRVKHTYLLKHTDLVSIKGNSNDVPFIVTMTETIGAPVPRSLFFRLRRRHELQRFAVFAMAHCPLLVVLAALVCGQPKAFQRRNCSQDESFRSSQQRGSKAGASPLECRSSVCPKDTTEANLLRLARSGTVRASESLCFLGRQRCGTCNTLVRCSVAHARSTCTA